MSETAACRAVLAPWCVGLGLDIGYGGDAVVPGVGTFDRKGGSYGAVGNDPQMYQGDCRDLSTFCDGSRDFIYSSHLVEDFHYHEIIPLIREWRRVLGACSNAEAARFRELREHIPIPDAIKESGLRGLLITNCPDQQKFLAHCAATGQGLNMNHKESDFSLKTFRQVLALTGEWEELFVEPEAGAYSWYLVVRKVG